MDLLKAYGTAKKVVEVAPQIEIGDVSKPFGGRFAGKTGQGSLGLPEPVSSASQKTLAPVREKEQKRERPESGDEDEEEEDMLGLARLPDLAPHEERAAPRAPVRSVAPSAPGPSVPGPSKPSQMYTRYAEVEEMASYREADDEEAEERVVVQEISQATLMKDQARIQQELHHEIAAPPASRSTSFGGRKKHQLSSMAMEANDSMSLYEAEKANAARSRKQVRAKYGW
jgi:hypothetical protein